MGNKASGKSYTSKGQHSNVKASTLSNMRKSISDADRTMDRLNAWIKGQNPWMTIDNPSKERTDRRQIRVRANDIYGNPKERLTKGFQMKSA